MTSLPRVVALIVLAVLRAASSRARAQEAAEPPSPVLLGAGIAVAIGGGALTYYSAHNLKNNSGSYGDVALNSLGTLTMQVGGALETVWAWQLGESNLSYDLRGNVPLASRRPLALGALAVGAAALVAMYVGIAIVTGKEVSCISNGSKTADQISNCAGDAIMTATYVNLAAGGVLLVAAPVAGYGFGYDAAARDSGHAFSMRVLPQVGPDGGGLSLTGRF